MASRFWVGGTGTWDASDTTHWAASTGGAGGQSVPGSADSVTFDGSSGGGTVTVNTTVTVTSITCGAWTGTLDFAANDNNVTLSGSSGFAGSGSGTCTINLGDGTWTLSNVATIWDATNTNLTLVANASTILFSATVPTGSRSFTSGGKTYNNLTIAGVATTGFQITMGGAAVIGTMTVSGINTISFPSGVTTTITNLIINGTASLPVIVASSASNNAATVTATNVTANFVASRFITYTNACILHNSFNLGSNTNATIIPPGIRPGFALGM